jgi:hypothetical protein
LVFSIDSRIGMTTILWACTEISLSMCQSFNCVSTKYHFTPSSGGSVRHTVSGVPISLNQKGFPLGPFTVTMVGGSRTQEYLDPL